MKSILGELYNLINKKIYEKDEEVTYLYFNDPCFFSWFNVFGVYIEDSYDLPFEEECELLLGLIVSLYNNKNDMQKEFGQEIRNNYDTRTEHNKKYR